MVYGTSGCKKGGENMALGKVMRAGEGCRPGEKLGRAFRPIHIQTQTCPHFHVLYYTSWIGPVNSRLWYYCFPLNCSLRHQMGIQRQTFWATLFPCSWMWLGLLWWLEGGKMEGNAFRYFFFIKEMPKICTKTWKLWHNHICQQKTGKASKDPNVS